MSDNYSPREAGVEVNSFMHRYYKELSKTDEYKDTATYDVHLESIDPKTKLYPVYVQLFATKLPIDKLIRIASNADYSHATIALDPSMNNMYSFASLPYTKGILGGDVSIGRESIWSPWYQCCRFFTVLVTFVDKKGRDAIQNKIDYFIEHHEEFDYNTIGCVEYFFGQKNFNNDERAKTKWFCSEFVAACLDTGGVEGHKNIYMSPGDLAKTPNMIEIGTYTLDSFDEKDVIKKTKIAEKQFRRDMTLNEAFTDYPDSEELSEAAFDFFKKIPRTSAQKEAVHKSRITAFIDWKKLADEFSKLFPKTKPELRFSLIELIVNKKVRAADVTEKDATNVIVKEMHNIRNKIRHGFIRLIDSIKSLITFRNDTEDISVQYPNLNVVQDQSSDQGLVFESTLNEYIHTSQLEDPDERKAMMKKYGLRPAGYGQDTRKEDEERMKKSHEWEKKIPLRQRKKIYREDGEGLVPGHEEVGDPDDVLPIEESYVFNKKLLVINEDKWGRGAHNILFITGLSGSGKSTLSIEFEQAGKAEMFDIDGIEQGYDTTEKTKILTEYSKQNKDFAEFYDLVSNPNKYSNKSADKFRKEVFTKYHTKYEGWLRDIIKLLHKHSDTLYTVNGVQLFEVMNPEDFKGEPVAIVGTSVANSMLRRMRRNSIDAGHGGKIQWKKEFENEFFQMLAWYFDDEKQLRKFKKGLKETAVSDDTKGTDQDFHNVGKAAGWYKGWTADGCQFDLEGVAQDNDVPDSGADGAYRVEAPVDSQDEPWLGTVHNLNNPDKSVNESILDRFRKTIPAKDAEKLIDTVVNKLKVLVKPYHDARLQPSYYGMTDRNKCIMIEMLDLDLGQYEREGYSDTLKDLCKKLENDRDIKKITEIKGFSNGDGDEGCIYINLKHPVDDTIHENTNDLPDKVLADPTNPTMVDKYRKLGYEFDPSRGAIRGRAQYMYYGVKINEPAEEPKFTIDIDQSGKGVCTDTVIKKLKAFIESRLNQVSTDNPEGNANIAKELLYAVDLIETYLINNVDKRSVYYCELINLRTLAIDFVAKVTETDASVAQDYERVKPGWHTIADGKLTTLL